MSRAATPTAVLRLAYRKALSTLVRFTGALDTAEDLLQDAAAKAIVRWPEDGVPERPAAWLVRAARNQAIDHHRRSERDRKYRSDLAKVSAEGLETQFEAVEEVGLRDDMLRLIFTCCHPVLTREAQIALTLKAIAGLSVDEIARAFVAPPKTIEQRITRAKQRIRQANVPYEVPARRELSNRLDSVLAVVHLIFNEGHSASSDAPLIRHELCRLAIGQAHLLSRLFVEEPEVQGLLALLLLSHARSPARVTADGAVVPLDRQDRRAWNQEAIREGLAVLDGALRRCRPGPYQIQAAISATHCRAQHWKDTDWPEILRLYDALLAVAPTSVVRLNRAVAVSRVSGPRAGLALLEELRNDKGMTDRHPFFAVRAGLFEELGCWNEARRSYRDALQRTTNASEIRYFRQKLEEVQKKPAASVGDRAPGSSTGVEGDRSRPGERK